MISREYWRVDVLRLNAHLTSDVRSFKANKSLNIVITCVCQCDFCVEWCHRETRLFLESNTQQTPAKMETIIASFHISASFINITLKLRHLPFCLALGLDSVSRQCYS